MNLKTNTASGKCKLIPRMELHQHIEDKHGMQSGWGGGLSKEATVQFGDCLRDSKDLFGADFAKSACAKMVLSSITEHTEPEAW